MTPTDEELLAELDEVQLDRPEYVPMTETIRRFAACSSCEFATSSRRCSKLANIDLVMVSKRADYTCPVKRW